MARENISNRPPVYDDAGINLADPSDPLGWKTDYISLLQLRAIERYVGRGHGLALDLGCGYGRMTRGIADLGYDVVGVEPSLRVVSYAASAQQELRWCVGRMPLLPFADGAFGIVMLLNVLRPLHLMGDKNVCGDAARLIARGGRLVVIDNIRVGDPRYIEERWFVDFFAARGLKLARRTAIRAARWPIIYMIRYGLIPRAWFSRIADWEISRMARETLAPRWQYHNVLFVFERA